MPGVETNIVSGLVATGPLAGVLGYAVIALWKHTQELRVELLAARTETVKVRRDAQAEVAAVRKECADKTEAIHANCEAKIEQLHQQNIDVLKEFAMRLRESAS